MKDFREQKTTTLANFYAGAGRAELQLYRPKTPRNFHDHQKHHVKNEFRHRNKCIDHTSSDTKPPWWLFLRLLARSTATCALTHLQSSRPQPRHTLEIMSTICFPLALTARFDIINHTTDHLRMPRWPSEMLLCKP